MWQRAPRNQEEVDKCRPLEIPPDQVLQMTEVEWYEKIYRGEDMPQLTLRAVLMGSVLGFFLAFTNLYIGLKTGWGLGVAITACILAYAIWNTFIKIGLAKTPMTILETNCMQSTASSPPRRLLLRLGRTAPGGTPPATAFRRLPKPSPTCRTWPMR